jgi:carbamoyltransferase
VRVLGVSAFYHDSAVALVEGGVPVFAAQEERYTRKRHDASFPHRALESLLQETGLRLRDVDRIYFYEKPFLKLERLLETYLAFAPRGLASFRAAMGIWISDKLFQRQNLVRALDLHDPEVTTRERLRFSEHHLSHAASAFFPSPFEQAAVLTLDGAGEWSTLTTGVGRGSDLLLDAELRFPHSLGLLYSAFTYYTGFRVGSGEYKLMGLAPYGEPRFEELIRRHLIDVKEDGSFRLDLGYFDYCTGLRMTNARFDALFGGRPRSAEEPLEQRHMDLAASIQKVTDDVVVRLGRALRKRSGQARLCMAGGVALNCVANGALVRDGAFEQIWIQPAAGDAGGALGAALAGSHLELGVPREARPGDAMNGALLGPRFDAVVIRDELCAAGARYEELPWHELVERAARALAEGLALGWFQDRMELGPRALGSRSILCDPRRADAQRVLNSKIKFRESFRPFAPAVLSEHASDWFELSGESPYMLLCADVAPERRRALPQAEASLAGLGRLAAVRSEIPAVTHVDLSARVQTVDAQRFPQFHALLSRFHALTGCPVLVNTSFNVRGEPIVCTPTDAFRCFMGTELDALAIGPFFLGAGAQDRAKSTAHRQAFAPD